MTSDRANHNDLQTWALLLATGMTLGLAVPLGKLAVSNGVAPLNFVAFSALGSGVLLAALAWWRHGVPADIVGLLRFGLVAGVLGNAIPNSLAAWLAAQAGAGFTAVAYTLPPMFTLLLSLIFRLERAQGPRVLAIGLSLSGALWLAHAGISEGQLGAAAALALLAIPAVIGSGNIYRALHLPRQAAPEWLGALMMLGAAAVLLPLWALSPAAPFSATGDGLPFVAAQTAAGTLAALLFFRLQPRTDAVTMSLLGYVLALTALLLGAWWLGETLPPRMLPATALIVTGFWLIRRHAPRSVARAGATATST